jgi:hypothetical protein
MKLSDDVSKLYEGFGGDAATYQEFGRLRASELAIKNWSLFAELMSHPILPASELTSVDEPRVFDAKYVYMQWYRTE